ncbi:hypothetical protein EOM39_05860 [Candidatus Gracilibacteria bacterium]|nr:hypothetical protein [Candidatus Gracilibacteria bacterium]
MRYYVAYRHQGADIRLLINNLNIISRAIETSGNSTYIFFRDGQKWGEIIIPIRDIMPLAFQELDNSDGLFAFVDNKEKSEGMLIECGYAKAKGKKIVLAIKKGIDLRLLRTIADEIIEFSDISDLEGKISNLL